MCAHNHTEPRPSKAVHLQASIVTFSKLSYLVGSQALHVCTEVTGRSQAHAGLQMSAVFVCCAHTWPELMAMRLSFLKSRPGKDAEFGLCAWGRLGTIKWLFTPENDCVCHTDSFHIALWGFLGRTLFDRKMDASHHLVHFFRRGVHLFPDEW